MSEPRMNYVGGTTIPVPSSDKLVALGKAYLAFLIAHSVDSWDMEQKAREHERRLTRHDTQELIDVARNVSIALGAIEEGME